MWPAAVVVVEVVQELQLGSPVAEPAGAARGRHRLRLRRGGVIFGGEEAGAGVLKVDDDGRPVVTEVAEGSLAEEAGLEPGDVITDLGGYSSFSLDQLDQLDQLRTVLAARRLITLGVRRGSEQLRLSVSLGDLAA
jgi:S1-C subfamily serine protease